MTLVVTSRVKTLVALKTIYRGNGNSWAAQAALIQQSLQQLHLCSIPQLCATAYCTQL